MFFPRVPGPGARERLGDMVLRDVVERFHALSERQRKDDAFARRQLWDENFTNLIKALIGRVYSDAEVIHRMNTFVSVSINPAKDITKAVAVVYKRGVHRLLADATDTDESNWLKLYAEGAAELQGLTWNRFAFLLGPVLVAPVIRNGTLIRETILPYQVELELDETGRRPTAALWAVRNGASYRRAPHNWREVSYVYVDREKWVYLDDRGERTLGPDGLKVVEHGLRDANNNPVCPLAVFRLDEPTAPDWWSAGENERLLSGTIEAAFTWARLDMIRSRQDSHFLFASQRKEGDFPEEQLVGGDPESSVMATGATGTPTLQSIAYSTDPAQHISHIRAKVGQLCLPYGISPDSIAYNFGGGDTKALSIRLGAEQQGALRNEQVPFIRRAELDLAVLQASAVRAAGSAHWYSSTCPSPDEVADRFIFEVPELNRVEDPRARREDDDWQLQRGLKTVVDLARDRWRLPPARTRKRIEANLEINAKYGIASTVTLPTADKPADLGSDIPVLDPSRPPGSPAGAQAGPPPPDVQRSALNGAQVGALQAFLLAVSNKELAPGAAKIAIAQSFPMFPPEQVTEMVAEAAAHTPPTPTKEPTDGRRRDPNDDEQQRHPDDRSGDELDLAPDN